MTVAPLYTLAEIPRQVAALGEDLRSLYAQAADAARELVSGPGWAGISHVIVTGNGDSFHAALAAQMAFHTFGGVVCEPVSTLRLLAYGTPWQHRPALPAGTLVVGVSASGGNARVVDALVCAAGHGARTLAVTAAAGSAVARAAEHALVVPLQGLLPCPGIRTYQASLLSLFLIAIEIGRVRGHLDAHEADAVGAELAAAADAVTATAAMVRPGCAHVAERVADAPVVLALGSGPGYGSAQFAAAKLVEAAGVFATGQDLEEWEHVEVLAHPLDMPTLVFASPGRTRDRALAVARRARAFGRTVVAVGQEGDADLASAAGVLSLAGGVREEFSPLLTQVVAGYLAGEVADRLGRVPFSTNRP
ncbi:SIS domain-containing protein (plasmid) [Streptosporangium sp. CA-135522]|uniref:SIS domain-containing protein n=1 Tax=Streptosporangium sp. CA-135522 TaxID=3240072 RepID=UPI003D942EB7